MGDKVRDRKETPHTNIYICSFFGNFTGQIPFALKNTHPLEQSRTRIDTNTNTDTDTDTEMGTNTGTGT